MAHKKGLGSSKNGRDSHAQRLGVKVSDNAAKALKAANFTRCFCGARSA